MITNSTKPGYTFLRKIMVLPVIAMVISMIVINCTSKDVVEKEEPSKIDIATIPDVHEEKMDSNPDSVVKEKVAKTNPSAQKNIVFEKTENEPQFPGGSAQWRKYLEKRLNANTPVDNGATEGMYTVEIQFIVNENGFISDVKALTNHGYGMEEEVIDLIEKGPKWIPAKQNGKIVRAFKKQPVTFVVSKEF